MGTGGTGGQPHLTGSAGTTGTAGTMGAAGTMGTAGTMGAAGSPGTGGTGGTTDPRCNALDGMVSWWHADGDYDDAVGSNDGASAGDMSFVAGVQNQAFNFDGNIGAYVQVPHDPSLMMSGAITIDAWINEPVLGGRIVDKATAFGNDGYLLDIVGGQLRMFVGTDSVLSPGQVPAGMWVHVAGVFNGSDIGVYINGALAADHPTSTTAIPANTLQLHIGADSGGDSQFVGQIDEPRVWNRALSADEIAQLFWQSSNCH
jgi:hypothetical protein